MGFIQHNFFSKRAVMDTFCNILNLIRSFTDNKIYMYLYIHTVVNFIKS